MDTLRGLIFIYRGIPRLVLFTSRLFLFTVFLALWGYNAHHLRWEQTFPHPTYSIPYVTIMQRATPLKKRARVRPTRPTNDVTCLAQNIYFESAQEPTEGQEAIAATVFHRAAESHRSLCSVVYQHKQYSWTGDWSKWTYRPAKKYLNIARDFLHRRSTLMETYAVTHFHRLDVSPRWSAQFVYVGTFGLHKFYDAHQLSEDVFGSR